MVLLFSWHSYFLGQILVLWWLQLQLEDLQESFITLIIDSAPFGGCDSESLSTVFCTSRNWVNSFPPTYSLQFLSLSTQSFSHRKVFGSCYDFICFNTPFPKWQNYECSGGRSHKGCMRWINLICTANDMQDQTDLLLK